MKPTTRIALHADPGCRDCRRGGAVTVLKHGHRDGVRWQVGQVRTPCTAHDTIRLDVKGPAGQVVLTVSGDNDAYQRDSVIDRLFSDLSGLADGRTGRWCMPAVTRVAELAAGDPRADGETLLLWSLAGFRTGAEVAAGVAAGLDAVEAEYWSFTLGLTNPVRAAFPLQSVTDLLAWWAAAQDDADPVTMPVVNRWLRLGVYRAEDRPEGLSIDDVAVLWDAGLDPEPGWAGAEHVCPDLLPVAAGMGHSPADTVALCRALRSYALPTRYCHHTAVTGCEWGGVGRRIAEDILPGFTDVDWADAAACLRAGMDPHEAIAHLRSGAEMEPVRLLAALTG